MVDQPESQPLAPPHHLRLAALIPAVRVGALVALIGLLTLALYLVISGVDLPRLAAIGLPGITLILFFSSATVFLPAPGIAAVGLAGATWHPALVGVFAALGSSLGEMTGYLVGYGGRKALGAYSDKWWWKHGEYFMRRWGFVFVMTMAAIPNPFFDAVGILAGSLRFPARKVLLAVFLGNTLKYTAAAALGDAALGWWAS